MLIGCGLGVNEDTVFLVERILEEASCPVILDADGINIAAAHIDMLKNRKAPLLLTPHPGEMARLCGCTAAEIQADRTGAARRFAREYGVTLVLKGANTVIAGENAASLFVNRTGNPGMAQGAAAICSRVCLPPLRHREWNRSERPQQRFIFTDWQGMSLQSIIPCAA